MVVGNESGGFWGTDGERTSPGEAFVFGRGGDLSWGLGSHVTGPPAVVEAIGSVALKGRCGPLGPKNHKL